MPESVCEVQLPEWRILKLGGMKMQMIISVAVLAVFLPLTPLTVKGQVRLPNNIQWKSDSDFARWN
jgi:hypothetical protein